MKMYVCTNTSRYHLQSLMKHWNAVVNIQVCICITVVVSVPLNSYIEAIRALSEVELYYVQ